MGAADEIRSYLDLSRQYLGSARRSLDAGERAPANFLMLHGLELAIKAALAAKLDEVPRTHNVGGLFGKIYRDAVPADVMRRMNRLLMDYDGPRYPEWMPPADEAVREELRFVERFVEDHVRKLVEVG